MKQQTKQSQIFRIKFQEIFVKLSSYFITNQNNDIKIKGNKIIGMSTLPEIYSVPVLRNPKKQGGIFSINLLNNTASLRNSLNQSFSPQNIYQIQTARTNKTFGFINSSAKDGQNLPNASFSHSKTSGKIFRQRNKSKSIFSHSLNKTVVSDHLAYIQNAEESDNVGVISKNMINNIRIINNVLEIDSNEIQIMRRGMMNYQEKIQKDLRHFKHDFLKKTQILYEQLSVMRKQTLSETKINRRLTDTLIEQSELLKQIVDKNIKAMDTLEKACRS